MLLLIVLLLLLFGGGGGYYGYGRWGYGGGAVEKEDWRPEGVKGESPKSDPSTPLHPKPPK
jgi:hypothetical protein